MREGASIGGYLVVLVSALAFAGNNALTVVAYEGGATPLTLITFRMIFTLAALAAILWLMGATIRLPARERYAALALGALNGTMAYCLVSAFHHIAVGLAVLVFYLYPVFTGLGAWLTGQERLNRGLVVGLAGGFVGLALAIEVTGEVGNTTGLLFAAAAAVMMAVTALLSARYMSTGNARAVILHMHISSSALFVVISLIAGHLALPTTTQSWAGLGGVLVLYTLAVTAFFSGIAYVGAVRASLVMNLEPVASITLGFVLLGQLLTPRQLLGAAIVIAAVTAVKWMGGRRA